MLWNVDRTMSRATRPREDPSHRFTWGTVIATLLLPFVLLSTAFAGTMPLRGADGMVELVLCTGNGFATVTLPQAEAPPGTRPADEAHAACPWDEAASPALPAATPALGTPPIHLHAFRRTPPVSVADIRGLARRVTNRGPPRPV